MAQKKLSTGILVRDPASSNAHVDIGNLNQSSKRKVEVEIFDWGVDQLWSNPTPVPVGPPGAVTIDPHTLRSYIALITQSTAQPGSNLVHYEVRITVSDINGSISTLGANEISRSIDKIKTSGHSTTACWSNR